MSNDVNLVLLFDGTDNDLNDTVSLTNVAKLKKMIAYDGIMPEAFYSSGVGTQSNEKEGGSILGLGIQNRLGSGFRWLTNQFNDPSTILTTKRIFLFGFSRGAYIARAFSWLIHYCGIPSDANQCEELLQLFWQRKYDILLEKRQQNNFTPEIELLGVWDTVKSAPLCPDFNDTELCPNVIEGAHAMSLDEKRSTFPVLKWEKYNPSSRMTQEWFPGIHSDIGGGYAEADLSDITLLWMLELARKHHLHFQADLVQQLKPNPCGKMHNEADKAKWKALGRVARHIVDEPVNQAVFIRCAQSNYQPYAIGYHASTKHTC